MPPPDPCLAPDLERTRDADALVSVDATALDIVPVTGPGEGSQTATLTSTSHPGHSAPAPAPDTVQVRAVSLPPGTVLAGRYRLDEQVGAGGGGLVYRGVDLEGGERVAIKLLRPERVADARARQRFRREFRAIARLDHPHCLRVRGEGSTADHLFMVMDYVPGGNLNRLAGAPVERLLPILIKLADALDYVHGQRIVHRDLKPSNVLLGGSDPPEPLLADFGIAEVDGEPGDMTVPGDTTVPGDRPGGAPGTVDFMSPEQVRGDPVDPRSDLYAFGCLVFSLLAGRPPFEGSSYNRLVARLLHPAPPLDTLCDVEPALARIVDRLLQKDPNDRYQSALDLVRDLAELAPDVVVALEGGRGAAYLFEPGLVGREATLSALLARIDAALTDPEAPGVVAVVAPAGTGKSRLTHAALRAHPGRAEVFRVEAVGGEPLAPWPALERIFVGDAPEADHPGTARPAAEPWATSLRARADRLADGLRRAAEAGPTIIVLDDLHLAEPGALALLADVASRLAGGPHRPVFVSTSRPVGLDDLERLGRRVPVHRLMLEPLTPDATALMVARMLGASVAGLPAELAPFVHRTSRGNPLLVATDVQVLAESGALVRVRGGWVFDAPAGRTDLMATERLRARLGRLAASTRRVLAHAAVCGERFDTDLLTAAFAFPEGLMLDAIDEGVRARVLVPVQGGDGDRDRYAFAHARLTEVLYASVDDRERPAAHRAVAAQLAARPETPLAVLAHHHARGDDRLAAFEASKAAGEAALAAYAFEAAGRLFEQAIERLDALPEARRPAARMACEEHLADVHLAQGRIAEAVALLEGLSRDESQPVVDRARRLRKLGIARLRTPDNGAGVAALEQALEALGDRVRRTRAGTLFTLVRDALGALTLRYWPRRVDSARLRERAVCHRELAFMYRWIDSERSGAHIATSIRLATLLDDTELLVDGYSHASMGFAFAGIPGPAQRLEAAARRMAIEMRDRFGEARVEVLSGALDALLLGDEPAARAHFDKAMAVAGQVGDRFLTDFVLAAKGWCMGLFGHLDEGMADFAAARVSAESLGSDWLRADANGGMMMMDIAADRLDDAARRARKLAGPEIAVPMPALGALGTEGLGAIAFEQGRFRVAIGLLDRARRQYVTHHLERSWGYLVELEHFEALLCLVDIEGRDAVPDLIPQLRRLARQSLVKLSRMKAYAGCREVLYGTIAARRGRAEKARALFARGLARRSGPPRYFDTWLRVRSTIERMHLGDPLDGITADLDGVAEVYTSLGIHGMNRWLAHMRRHYGV